MHPLVKIIFLIVLLLIINLIAAYWLAAICVMMIASALIYGNGKLLTAISRMRWLWLSIVLIYAFSTPGEYISIFSTLIKVTYEGVQSGLLQMLKLLTAIGSINFLFSNSSKTDLLAGLNALLMPLKWLGLDVEAFSARLFLTLEYVDDMAINSTMNISFLNALDEPHNFLEHQYLHIPRSPLLLIDKLTLCFILAIGISVIASKVML